MLGGPAAPLETRLSLDPRTPVLVGAGQIHQRQDDPARSEEPLALMERAAECAAADAGARDWLRGLDAILVPRGLWRYSNPGALLRERFGTAGARTGLGPISGSTVQTMISWAAREIASGRSEAVLVVGGEGERSARRARAQGIAAKATEQRGSEPDLLFGSHDPGFGWWEARHRVRPIQAFSLYENALRAFRGETSDAHRARIARLWEGFARVAAANPHAWIRDAPSAERIATPAADNPMVGFPYTKRMVANMVVDQAAAVIVCSHGAARRRGVADERLVFLQAATDATRRCPVAERLAYHEEPALGLAGRRALALAEASPGDLAHVDLYSCFPSAVQIAAAELGFDLARELTVTGGLTFAGGPFNSYVLHAIATVVQRLRAAPGTRGFVSSVGGYMAKHAFAIYGTEPSPRGFRHECLDEAVSALPRRPALQDYEGPARVETFAVTPGLDGAPGHILFSCLVPDCKAVAACSGGAAGEVRAFATSGDLDLLAAVGREELCGLPGRIRDGVLQLG
jgi:acetyl-CoA C-acetyltransferase